MTDIIQMPDYVFPECMDQCELKRQSSIFEGSNFRLLDLLQEIVIITNISRQIVFANQKALNLTTVDRKEDIYGLLPGKAFNCKYEHDAEQPCGETPHCARCGSLFALIQSSMGNSTVKEFSFTRYIHGRVETLDVKVAAYPVLFCSEKFIFFTMTDISHEKRRNALEHVFYHDVLNTAGGIRGLASLMIDNNFTDIEFIRDKLKLFHRFSDNLIQEIETQRIISYAEIEELDVSIDPFDPCALIEEIASFYKHHQVCEGKTIQLIKEGGSILMESDRNLVSRVLGNMLKNALEATEKGGTVDFGYRVENGKVEFQTRNAGYIPKNIQLQIFSRSFSTKGLRRGLGTYGMKMISEQFLEGKVFFYSSENEGTVFKAVYPVVWPAKGVGGNGPA